MTRTRRTGVRGLVVAALILVLVTQGGLLNSDVAHEYTLAVQLLRGNVHADWHASHFPLLPSLVLLPAALVGRLVGSQAAEFAAAVEFLLLGLLVVDRAARWRALRFPSEPGRRRRLASLVLLVGTPLWVYVVKAPMDVVLTAAAFAVAVLAVERDDDLTAGIALALAMGTRDQAIPIVAIALVVLAWRLLVERSWKRTALLVLPSVAMGLAIAAVNDLRYGAPLRFGPGYQSHVSFVPSVLWQLLTSPRTGLLLFAPIVLVASVLIALHLRDRAHRSPSVVLAGTLSLATFASAFLVHPNTDPSLLAQWYGWGAGVRFVLPAMPLVLGMCPWPRSLLSQVSAAVAVAVGFVWNDPMALVAYNAQERIPPIAGFHPPSPIRQYALIPDVLRNTWSLLLHGTSPLASSAYFLPDWQVEVTRAGGRPGELAAALVSAGLVGLLVVLWRRGRPST